MKSSILAAIAVLSIGRVCRAQEWSAEGHGNGARTTVSHETSWGAGGQAQTLWGAKQAPARLGISLSGDWERQEHGGPTQWSASSDVTIQPGGTSALTPYAGVSASANWLRGAAEQAGALLGLEYLAGVQAKPSRASAISGHVELRNGYVRTQEHTVTVRAGLSISL